MIIYRNKKTKMTRKLSLATLQQEISALFKDGKKKSSTKKSSGKKSTKKSSSKKKQMGG